MRADMGWVAPATVTCTGCGEECFDFRKKGEEQLCILCVEVQSTAPYAAQVAALEARVAELEARVAELGGQLVVQDELGRELAQLCHDLAAAQDALDGVQTRAETVRNRLDDATPKAGAEADQVAEALDGRR